MYINPQVSFIIPAYNAENTIKDCVNSILKIKNYDIEVIVIDDGSQDNTLKICDEFCDNRVRVFRQDNSGVSVARNNGISKARGSYIGFCDADDMFDAQEMQDVLLHIREENDLIMFNVRRSSEVGCFSETLIINEGQYGKAGIDFLRERVLDVKPYKNWTCKLLQGSVWRYLYKRDMILNAGIFFDKGVPYAEDLCFCLRVFMKAQNIRVVDKYAYIVNEVQNSASRKLRKNFWGELKQVFDIITMEVGERKETLYYHYGKSAIMHYYRYLPVKVARTYAEEVVIDKQFVKAIDSIGFKERTIKERFFDWSCKKHFFLGVSFCGEYEKIYWKWIVLAVRMKEKIKCIFRKSKK